MQLNFIERGSGEPIILIHGLFGSAGNLGMVARGLAGQFRVCSLDIRNHGHSPHADSMTYPEMTADVLAFMDAQGIDSCAVLGHSMGGKIAMQLAMDAPQRVGKLIVADVAPVAYPPHHADTLAGLQAVAAQTISSRGQADGILARTIDEASVRAFLLKSLQRDDQGHYHWLLNVQGITGNYAQLGAATIGPAYNGPTLFLRGGESKYVEDRYLTTIFELFPQAEIATLDGCGHWLHAENPAQFNATVLDFLVNQ